MSKSNKALLVWLICSWVFLILGFCGVWAKVAVSIGMPTSFSFEEVLGFPLYQIVIFCIGGLMFLTCVASIALGLLAVIAYPINKIVDRLIKDKVGK